MRALGAFLAVVEECEAAGVVFGDESGLEPVLTGTPPVPRTERSRNAFPPLVYGTFPG